MTMIRTRTTVAALSAGAAGIAATGFFLVGAQAAPAAPAPMCGGQEATIVGTGGEDDINGTNRRDVIVGLGGEDDIDGRGGNDIICGNAGGDDLEGDAGNDRLIGGQGRDEADGGRGNDNCSAEEKESC